MQDLSIYLKKFTLILGDKTAEKKVVQHALLLACNITLSDEHIDVRDGTIGLRLSPLQKTEIHMKRKELLQTMKEGGLMAQRIG